MEFGIFNGAYVPATMTEAEGRHAEARRFKEEVAWVQAADRARPDLARVLGTFSAGLS